MEETNVAKVIEAANPHAAWQTMNPRTMLTIFLYGLGVGVFTYVAYVLLERFVFDPILCTESTALVRCETKTDIAAGMAIIVGAIGGLALLVRERVYRPILAILGVCISLWGVFSLIVATPAYVAVMCVALLFASAYVLFSWLVQPTSLVVSIAGVIVASALARIALS